MIINLDEEYVQTGFMQLDLTALGLPADDAYTVEDLLTGERYPWQGARNFVRLNPQTLPAHIFTIIA